MKPNLKEFAASLDRGELLLPLLKKHMEKEARLMRKGLLRHSDIVKQDAQMTVDSFTARIAEYNHREKLEGQYFHPSQIGACLRKTFFAEMDAPSDGNEQGADLLKSHLTFEIGTYFHCLFQNLCERAGYLTAREVAIKDKVNRILGHMDARFYIENERMAGEIKTMNQRRFTALKVPEESHKQQVTAYMKSEQLERAVIVYIAKDTSQVKEFVIKFSELFWLSKVKARIDMFFDAIADKVLPDREGASPYKFPCSYCQFQRLCYDTEALKKWTTKKGIKQ